MKYNAPAIKITSTEAQTLSPSMLQVSKHDFGF
jgi:hypothetical protein